MSWWLTTGGSEKEVWEYRIRIGIVPFKRIGMVNGSDCFGCRQKGFPAGLILAVLFGQVILLQRADLSGMIRTLFEP